VSHDVFLCYAAENREAVEALCSALEDAGVKCWMAPRDIDPGVSYAASIMRAISTTQLFILVFSHHANASPHVSRELERAVNLKLPIVPLLIEDVEPNDEIGYYISSTQWFVVHPPPLDAQLAQIVKTIKRGLGREDQPASSPVAQASVDEPPVKDERAVPPPPPSSPRPPPPPPSSRPTPPPPSSRPTPPSRPPPPPPPRPRNV
jgi:TIR domain